MYFLQGHEHTLHSTLLYYMGPVSFFFFLKEYIWARTFNITNAFIFIKETWKSQFSTKTLSNTMVFFIGNNNNKRCFLNTNSTYWNYFWRIVWHWRPKIQLCHHRNKLYFKIYIQTEKLVEIIFSIKTSNIISQHCKFTVFYHINAALLSIKDFKKKHSYLKKLTFKW